MNSIFWTPKAAKQLRKIDRQHQGAIRDGVGNLADMPNCSGSQNIKALTNHQYGYRLRIGNYRVLFDWDVEIRIIDIQEVRKRDERTY
ncbi:type II toxin-antitoxin system RelE/ParE family toxin [Alcaligenes faecalis]|jgi:mRNA-degrading endonuclease RelE of RelBE toxin-antitoxin system|uniref:Type II toxin-antitoxin system RelE/ParE family toxin n=2 Tax=Alcaligenes TaxID=507 RepID=A0A0A2N5H0_ALCFA|nr:MULTISPECIES: type II toxin-antitoxin system RelE/ParE family toxin [Alcaligenes]MBX6964894.1 type II toxin-antitoxin system RelE/ParE family toxin [Providencia rettgeri]MDH4866407.1 type II toxin-antitoxin system RelE/ParE family toxin [Bacillus cereus]ATI01528.1 type II toxin-antitoxin system RelE/ParE family toxin [Alcaligenes faecalis]AYZ90883.1 type II toxin-antitoxin system RelE/ParE family toxin [Alcaligenes faecalis]KGP02646.1 cytotoxic translational repressor of toxin-antitoxin sta